VKTRTVTAGRPHSRHPDPAAPVGVAQRAALFVVKTYASVSPFSDAIPRRSKCAERMAVAS
jgi:hypothetical protein